MGVSPSGSCLASVSAWRAPKALCPKASRRRLGRESEWRLGTLGGTERPRSMSRRERVYAALRGEPVDRVPVSFWGHHYTAENSARSLAEVTLRRANEFGWDYLKPQSRTQCFAEMWGLTYAPSVDPFTK